MNLFTAFIKRKYNNFIQRQIDRAKFNESNTKELIDEIEFKVEEIRKTAIELRSLGYIIRLKEPGEVCYRYVDATYNLITTYEKMEK